MKRLLQRMRRPLAAVTFVALATVASLSCINVTGLTSQERACCEGMGGKCGPTLARDHGCCSSESGDQAFQQVAGGTSFSLHQPVQTLVATVAFLEPIASLSTAASSPVHESRGSPPGSRDVPTYLALSTIRV